MKTFDELLLEELYEMITPSKIQMFEEIAAQKTNYLTVVLENIYQEHNASAVMRTCEGLGIQNLHVVESKNEYKPQRDIARGSGRWIELHNYDEQQGVLNCINQLKSEGFRIVATTPHEKDYTIDNLPIDQPIALIFGTEGDGISKQVIDHADDFVKIPMYGFTESFNISVSVAISTYVLRRRIEKANCDWQLSFEELTKLKVEWCKRIIPKGELVVPEVIKRLQKQSL